MKIATEKRPHLTTNSGRDLSVSGANAIYPALFAPFTFCEAGIWIQVFLWLFHRDFLYFWFDVNGASFRGASVIQFLDTQGKGRSSKCRATRPHTLTTSGRDDAPVTILYSSYYKLIIT